MKTLKVIALVVVIPVCAVSADPEIPAYHAQNDFLLTSPGAMGFGLYGYANPALLKYVEKPDLLFTWSDASGQQDDFDRWGLFAGLPMPNLGFGMIRQEDTLGDVTDYRLSLAFGDRQSSFGIGYGWSAGALTAHNRSRIVTVGSLSRPIPQLSVGMFGTFATSGDAREGVLDLAVRPFGNEMIAVFGDYAIQEDEKLSDGHWSTGAALEVLPGIRLTGRYFDTHGLTVGINLSLGRVGLVSQGHYDEDRAHAYNTYAVRAGAMDRSLAMSLMNRRKKYMQLRLLGPIKYQRYRMFDKSNTLAGLLCAIDGAREDEAIAGIAINASGMRVNWELAWELREKLKEFRAAGKHVVVFIDDVSLRDYHFASVADKIVLDPTGEVFMEGFRLGNFYLKGTLEKLGLGFDEWRFFKYKSAYEVLSRDSMSEADREQRQKLVDDFYRLAKADICQGRGLDPAEFDRLVNEEMFLIPEDALELGLVDTLGRWEEVKKMVERIEGGSKDMVGPGATARYQLPSDNHWGKKPQVAVIYALGICAMDEGIKARTLAKVIESASNNRDIKAVVFRVDSPGGSGLASDVVAEALKKCTEKKPVIVSQGWVAASGGYWISMYGDTIVAAPNTITGSIGVIGGWVYNKGLKEKLGMSTDIVQVGDHADLGFGIPLPFVGTVPDRNLTEDERAKAEESIRIFYSQFVEKVASGRRMEYDDIHEIGQGRVWSGYDGLDNGLVDELGGLETAIRIAKAKAGIAEDEKVDIVQLPQPPLLNPQMFAPKLFGVEFKESAADRMIDYLEFRLDNNGRPMPLLSPDQLDYISEDMPPAL